MADTKGFVAASPDSTKVDNTMTDEDYIHEGLVKDYPDMAELGLEDDEFLDYIRRADFPEVKDDKQFQDILRRAYAPHRPNILEVAGGVAKAVAGVGGEFAKSAWQGAKEGFLGPAEAVGQLGAQGFESSLDEMGKLTYQDLLKRGYSPAIAEHVMKQRIDTQQGLAGELQQAGEKGQKAAIEGTTFHAGNAAFGAIDIGLSSGALAQLTKSGLGAAAKHALSGAAGFAVADMIHAAAEGKSASEIYDAGKEGAGIGVFAGPAMAYIAAPIAKGFGKGIQMVGQGITRYVEKKASMAAARQADALARQAEEFSEKFNADWLRTRFSDLPVVTDPATGLPPDIPNTLVAANIIQQVLGQDVLENTSEQSLAKLAEKIRMQRAHIGIEPSPKMRVATPTTSAVPMQEGMQAPMQTVMQELPEPTPREAIDALVLAAKPLPVQPHQGMQLPPGGMAPEATAQGRDQWARQPGQPPQLQHKEMDLQEQTNPAMDPGSLRGQTPYIEGATNKPPNSEEFEVGGVSGKPPGPEDRISGFDKFGPTPTLPMEGPGRGATLNPQPNITSPFEIENPEWQTSFQGTYDAWAPKLSPGETASPEILADFLHGFEDQYPKSSGTIIAPRTLPDVEITAPPEGAPVSGLMGQGKTPQDMTKSVYQDFVENNPATEQSLTKPPKKVPFNPPKPNEAKKHSKEWFINQLEDYRHGFIDMPEQPYVDKEKYKGHADFQALRRNKRLKNFFSGVASWVETIAEQTDFIKDPATKERLANEARALGIELHKDAKEFMIDPSDVNQTPRPKTSAEEVARADKLLDETIAAMKEKPAVIAPSKKMEPLVKMRDGKFYVSTGDKVLSFASRKEAETWLLNHKKVLKSLVENRDKVTEATDKAWQDFMNKKKGAE